MYLLKKRLYYIFLYYFPSVHTAFSVFHHSLVTLLCALTLVPLSVSGEPQCDCSEWLRGRASGTKQTINSRHSVTEWACILCSDESPAISEQASRQQLGSAGRKVKIWPLVWARFSTKPFITAFSSKEISRRFQLKLLRKEVLVLWGSPSKKMHLAASHYKLLKSSF